jgi:hypothetical protein
MICGVISIVGLEDDLIVAEDPEADGLCAAPA